MIPHNALVSPVATTRVLLPNLDQIGIYTIIINKKVLLTLTPLTSTPKFPIRVQIIIYYLSEREPTIMMPVIYPKICAVPTKVLFQS